MRSASSIAHAVQKGIHMFSIVLSLVGSVLAALCFFVRAAEISKVIIRTAREAPLAELSRSGQELGTVAKVSIPVEEFAYWLTYVRVTCYLGASWLILSIWPLLNLPEWAQSSEFIQWMLDVGFLLNSIIIVYLLALYVKLGQERVPRKVS